MRLDSARFTLANVQLAKEPRHIVNIEFPTASIYCTSHADISGVPGVVLNGVLQKPIVVSQRIVPDEGRSEIGSASFRLVDLASAFTDDIRSKLAAGNGLRRRRVRFYRGYAGFAFADMQLYQTQIVRDVAFETGVYQVDCNDVTREQRKEVFVVAQTTLTANVSPTDTTISVHSTTGFELVVHDAGYTDAPGATVLYFKIKDEIIRATGKTSNSFTGCTRAVFGTRATSYTVDPATVQDRREKVSEYIYLEGPVPKILYAIQTGILHGDSANLPATWHCGIDPALIRLADYTAIGPDLWVPGTPTLGVPCRFEGLTKTDGKRFTRTNILLDQTSINVHGRAPLRELSFKGLHGARHTDGFILKLVDSQRDRFAGPPERLSVDVLHLLNRAEVGDVIRGRYSTVRDYAGVAGPMDRAFEIQQFVDDGERLSFELFGSTAKPSVQSPTTAATALPDAWYTSQGTNLTSVLTIVADVVQAGTYNLTGNADLTNAGAIYYYAGNLTIADGATINFTGNIQLRIRGFLQINGDINGQGGGLAGVVDSGASLLVDGGGSNANPAIFSTIAGNPGYVGNSRGMDGVQVKLFVRQNAVHTVPCATVIGKHPTAPPLILSVVAGALVGLPTDIRGSGGAPGGRGVEIDQELNLTNAVGGLGAPGGAGLAITCRGMAFGASGSINLDGNDSAPTSQVTISDFPGATVVGFPGAGGAGGPGTLYVLLDGGGLSVPSIGINNFSARTGSVAINGNLLPKRAFNDATGAIRDVEQPVGGYLLDE